MTDLCKQWYIDRSINPRTNRHIKIGGPTYLKIEEECIFHKPIEASDIDKISRWYLHQGRKLFEKNKVILHEDILSNFHPDKLPSKIKHIQQKNEKVKKFIEKMFTDLNKEHEIKKIIRLKEIVTENKFHHTSSKKSIKKGMTFGQLKEIYIDIAERILESKKEISRREILKNYHPDKLPITLKEAIFSDTRIKQFAERIFAVMIEKQPLMDTHTIKTIIKDNRYLLLKNYNDIKISAPKKPSLKLSDVNTNELLNVYMSLVRFLFDDNDELDKKLIAQHFHPDKLPQKIKDASFKNSKLSTLVNRIFADLIKNQPFDKENDVEIIIKDHLSKLILFSPHPPKIPKPNQAPHRVIKQSFLNIIASYKSIANKIFADKKIIDKKAILINFHPDKLPLAMKKDISINKSFNIFTTRVFNTLLKKQPIESLKYFERVLNHHQKKLEL